MINEVLFIFLLTLISAQDDQQEIAVSLTPGTSKELSLPIPTRYSRLELSAFTHQESHIISFPCSIQTFESSHFSKVGQFFHKRSAVIQDTFWQGGNLWDVIQAGNIIRCIFESGQMISVKMKQNSIGEKEFQKLRTIYPLEEEKIPFGRLVSFQPQPNVYHTVYFSIKGCFYVTQSEQWIRMSGFNGDSFDQVGSLETNIYTSDRDKIVVYQIDLQDKKVTKLSTFFINFIEGNRSYPLSISKFFVDKKYKRILFIDDYQGVKYIQINKLQQGKAEHLLPFQNCQDIIFKESLIFVSCSHLIVLNATTLKLIQKVTYSFHVSRIFFKQGYLIAFGDNKYQIYSVSMNQSQNIEVQYILMGKIPQKRYTNFMYTPEYNYFVLFSKDSLEYGRITPSQQKIVCQNIKVAQKDNYKQLIGVNTATLKIHVNCEKKQESNFSRSCEKRYKILVTIIDINSYKWIFWTALTIVLILLAIGGALSIVKLSRRKKELMYRQLNEQSLVTEQEKAKDSDAKRQAQIQLSQK